MHTLSRNLNCKRVLDMYVRLNRRIATTSDSLRSLITRAISHHLRARSLSAFDIGSL